MLEIELLTAEPNQTKKEKGTKEHNCVFISQCVTEKHCPLTVSSGIDCRLSATTKDLVLHGPPCVLTGAHTCVGEVMEYCETARLRKPSVFPQEVSEQEGTLSSHLALILKPPHQYFPYSEARPFPAPYEKITTVPKVFFFFLKKNPKRLWPLLLDHNACCFCVQVDLNRLFLPFH